ncbi:hypothetical protein BAUCODRAFT_36018 [Baudoinia panamericana UAMH 10762]|uniref:Uncharacterized protein n=1 Tax=Baudoinia panamericana (strain UAMH 10762) TaxID=717646 RepID=M2N7H4_BAUPA|nr:uncharacterized protein BAUCODRAFT_36018 [Baudoinia panamericana UAMH 10762]EMC94760.1 hypothetical protein BAUCODRAFT_36018 [Baudoinia panamericana UAMH 10762]
MSVEWAPDGQITRTLLTPAAVWTGIVNDAWRHLVRYRYGTRSRRSLPCVSLFLGIRTKRTLPMSLEQSCSLNIYVG